LGDIVEKEVMSSKTLRKKDEMKIRLSLLSSDIEFMKKIALSPLV
jgi:hypothetical protein